MWWQDGDAALGALLCFAGPQGLPRTASGSDGGATSEGTAACGDGSGRRPRHTARDGRRRFRLRVRAPEQHRLLLLLRWWLPRAGTAALALVLAAHLLQLAALHV